MVIDGRYDVEAAEALGALSRAHDITDETASTIVTELDRDGVELEVRLRLIQALAELNGPVTRDALDRLADDSERRVAGTATYLLRSLR